MWLIDRIAEQRILEAADRGEFDDLPGAGKPFTLDDDRLVPEHLRAGYRLLKNAGFLPPKVTALQEIRDTEALLARLRNPAERDRTALRLRLLQARLGEGRSGILASVVGQRYREQLLEKLSERSETGGD